MKRFIPLLLMLAAAVSLRATDDSAVRALEKEVAAITAGPRITVVHFWAPWCSNCKTELANNGWSTFIDSNFDVKFVFITAWNAEDGRALLKQNDVGGQENFQLFLHPNASRKADRMTTFMNLPVSWLPTTWVFKDGQLRYALNYGELRFPILQQLIRDTGDEWKH